MANVSQHEAAELWEITRDHHTMATKLEWFTTQVGETQLRSMLEQHARRCRQVCQQLEGFLQGNGAGSFGGGMGGFSQSRGQNSFGTGGFQQAGGQAMDVMIACDCLKDCKTLAVQAVRGATEAAQPARGFLHQLAGEHLQMAEQCYHWLEQRGMYASPKADQQTIQEYSRTLHQLAGSGAGMRTGAGVQAGTQTPSHAYGTSYGSQFGQGGQYSGQYGGQFGGQYGSQYTGQYSQSGMTSGSQFANAGHVQAGQKGSHQQAGQYGSGQYSSTQYPSGGYSQ